MAWPLASAYILKLEAIKVGLLHSQFNKHLGLEVLKLVISVFR